MFRRIRVRNHVNEVLDTLEQERSILLNGPLSDLLTVASAREKCMVVLENMRLDLTEVDLKEIEKKASKNSVLLESSLAGIRSAMQEIKAQNQASKSMGTYTESGVRFSAYATNALTDRKA